MANDDDKKVGEQADYLLEIVERQGVAVSSVKDGHILIFKRDHLRKLLDAAPDQDTFIIFVKRPTFGN
jgi:hypothetical protein